jgi:hypothetical protein
VLSEEYNLQNGKFILVELDEIILLRYEFNGLSAQFGDIHPV